ncbi:MAG: metallophosphoesterase family protein [Candidatus Limnocylindria bacterium]
MRLLHFADLHLDAPFAWARPEVARLRRRNRRETLTRILQLADEERVDGVLCGGDLFEQERFTPDTVTFLRESFARTDRPIYLAPGNHDWYSPRSPYALVEWSPNVHLFTEAHLTPVELDEGVTLWGAAHRAPAGTAGFFDDFRTDRGGVHLALVHASEKSALPFQESGKEPHSPFDAAELEAAGIAHAFLGHYHVARDRARYTYPGNPDPLEFGESEGRGVVLATIAEDGSVTRDRRTVAVSQVHDLTVALDGCHHLDDVRQRIAMAIAPLAGSVRVTLGGEIPADLPVDARALAQLGEHLDGFVVRTAGLLPSYDLEAIHAEATVRGEFARDTLKITDDDRRRRVLITGLRALEGRSDLEVA